MTSEELSSKLLQSLREDVRRETGEAITAAVITVPAAFELDQCDATVRAAKLAGLDNATLSRSRRRRRGAYGAESRDERAFGLVPRRCTRCAVRAS